VAKKTRTPPPPRRVQAPRRREPVAVRDDARRQRMILYGLAASGVVLLAAVVLFFVLSRRDSGEDVAAAMQAAGCTYQTFPSEGRVHVNDLAAKVDYKTFPPTSGRHYGIPAIWDIYDRPINQLQSVHNLEHGGVVIQYGDDVPRPQIDRIAQFYRDDPNGMLVAPLPGLNDQIALTAWTHMAKCERFDEQAFTTFRDVFRGRGPERLPVDELRPGGT
jgi:hypothetical protein